MSDLAVLTLKIASSQAEKTIVNINIRLNQLDRTAKKTNNSLRNIGLGLGATFTAPILLAGRSALKAASEFEQARIAFGVFVGDVKEGTQIFEDLVKFSARTPLNLSSLQNAAQILLATEAQGSNLIDTLEILGNVSRADSNILQRMALNLGQVAAQGKLTGRELRDFAVAGVPLVHELAKQFGKTTSEIQDMVSKGKVGFDQVFEAFRSMAGEGGKFDGLLGKMANTLGGKFTTATDNVRIALASMIQPVEAPLKRFLDLVTRAAQFVASMSDSAKQKIMIVVAALAALGPAILLAIGAPAIAAAALLVGKLALIAIGVNEIRKMFGITWQEIGAGFMKAVGFIINFKNNWKIMTEFMRDNWKNILSDALQLGVKFFGNLINNAMTFIRSLGDVLGAGFKVVIATVFGNKAAKEAAKDNFKGILNEALTADYKGLIEGFTPKTTGFPGFITDFSLMAETAKEAAAKLESAAPKADATGGSTVSQKLSEALVTGSREAFAAMTRGGASDPADKARRKNLKANESTAESLNAMLSQGIEIKNLTQLNAL